MIDIIYEFLTALYSSGDASGQAVWYFVVAAIGLGIIGLIFRFISRVKSFALFGG